MANRNITGHQVIAGNVGQCRDLGIEQRQIDVLADAARGPMVECGKDRYGRVHAAGEIGNHKSDPLRAAFTPFAPVMLISPDIA